MKNNETCNAPKCLKPSGLIDWINCRLCNGRVHIKCANLSRTEARNLAEFKCSRCSLVITIPQCQDDNFRPDTLFNSGVVHIKRVPNQSRICGKGVGLSLFPSDSLSFESYEQFVRKSKKSKNDCFLAIFGLNLAMFLTSQPYDFDAIAHIGL